MQTILDYSRFGETLKLELVYFIPVLYSGQGTKTDMQLLILMKEPARPFQELQEKNEPLELLKDLNPEVEKDFYDVIKIS